MNIVTSGDSTLKDKPTGQQAPPPRLVERDHELSVLRDLVRRTATGRSGIVLVQGQGGVGRTALLHALAAEARRHGLRVVEAAGSYRRLPRFDALTALLDAMAAHDDSRASARRRRAGGHHVRTEHLRLPPLSAADGPAPPPRGPLLAWRRAVRSAAVAGPLLLSLDDADEADPESVRLLTRVMRSTRDLPVLLALGWRDGDEPAPLGGWATRSALHVLRPRPLTGPGIGLVARQLTGSAVEAGFQDRCLAATNGIPSLVTGLLAGLGELGLPPTTAGLDAAGEGNIPVFGPRTRRLLRRQPALTVRTAQAVAVLGDNAHTTTGAGLARVETTAFTRSLRRLETLGLVRPSEESGLWSFADPAVRHAVLADTPPGTRTDLHGRAARLLHDHGAPAADIAWHLVRNPAVARQPWARAVLREAARRAMLRGATTHAVELLRPCVPHGDEATCDPDLVMELGIAESRVDTEASVRHLTSVLHRVTRPDLRRTVLSTLIGGLTRTGRVARATELLAAEASAQSPSDPALRQLLQAQMLMAGTDNRDVYTELLGTVSLRLDLPGDTPEERALLACRAFVSVTRTEDLPQAVAAADRAVLKAGPITDSLSTLATAASALMYADRPHEAAAMYQQLVEGTDAVPDHLYAQLLALDAEAAARLGRLDRALQSTAAALEGAPAARATRHHALALAARLHALLDRGDVAAAGTLARAVPQDRIDDAWQWNEYLCARGRLRLVQDDPSAALADLAECGRRQEAWHRTNPAVSSWWYWAGQAHLALGDRAAAVGLGTRAVDLARPAGLPNALGAGLELLAAAAMDEHDRLVLLEEAESVLTGTRAALSLARVRVARGRALSQAGHLATARTVLRKGWEESHEIGARTLHEEAHGLLLKTGARPRAAASRRSGELTRSETKVARLAAAGQTNLQIAQALFVTRRTVEVHLTSVYRKFGLSGRKELRGMLGPAAAAQYAPRDDNVVL
ncbi:LuxR family transcriptional regulator [Streptomyces tauricus]|uniref:LuxR family transcriptional regulator n=1 Tax=Streptomyces tauricus TaxID=68274 RepID=UPI0033BA475C